MTLLVFDSGGVPNMDKTIGKISARFARKSLNPYRSQINPPHVSFS